MHDGIGCARRRRRLRRGPAPGCAGAEGLVRRFDIDELCELAASKDLGFRREHLVVALEYFDDINPEAFSAYTDDYNRLRDCIEASRRALNPPQRGREDPSSGQ